MKKIKIRSIILIIFLTAFANLANANDKKPRTENTFITGTQKGDYQLAERMLDCASFFKFTSEIANKAGMPANSEQAMNKFYGWHMAAMLPLLSGLSESRKTEAANISNSIVDIKKTEYLGRLELNGPPEMSKITKEFDDNCIPLVPLQEEIVNTMRSGN